MQPNLYDNDSEYSRLYLNKDGVGNVQGIFMINFLSLLQNNSNIFSRLRTDMEMVVDNVFNSSELLDIKVYRDRVTKKPINLNYEKYLNDTGYEESSVLIASRKDNTLITKLLFSDGSNNLSNKRIQCFSFNDTDMSKESSGAYQYRIEVMFKDGTYTYLKSRLDDLRNVYIRLQEYYQFSLSGFTKLYSYVFSTSLEGADAHNQPGLVENGLRSVFTPYYKDGAYNEQFYIDAQERFPDSPWSVGSEENITAVRIFQEISVMLKLDNLQAFAGSYEISADMIKKLSPTVTGSPQGIDASQKKEGQNLCHKRHQQL